MTTELDRKVIRQEAQKIARQLARLWPELITHVSLNTQEGEDAYLWIQAPVDLTSEVIVEASNLGVDLYNQKGIYVTPRMQTLET